MKQLLLLAATLMAITFTASAQHKYFTNLYWSIATPTGDMHDFVDQTSVAGFGADVQWWVNDHLSAGVVLGYNLWSDVYRGMTQQFTYSENFKGAINGTQVHTMNSFTFMLGGRYIFGGSRDVRPYVGLAAGAITSSQALDVSVVRFQETNWHLAFAPSLGISIPIDYNTAFDVSGRYSYALPSGTSLYGADDNMVTHWSVNVGFTWGN